MLIYKFKSKSLTLKIFLIIYVILFILLTLNFKLLSLPSNSEIFRKIRSDTWKTNIKKRVKKEFKFSSIEEANLLIEYLDSKKVEYNTVNGIYNWLEEKFDRLGAIEEKKTVLRKIIKEGNNPPEDIKDKVLYLQLLIENYNYL